MGGFCYTPVVTVYTLGHSTRSAEELLALLRAHGIGGIADVRRFPASRRHPQFARAPEGHIVLQHRGTDAWFRRLRLEVA